MLRFLLSYLSGSLCGWFLFDDLVSFTAVDHPDLGEVRQKVGPHYMVLLATMLVRHIRKLR